MKRVMLLAVAVLIVSFGMASLSYAQATQVDSLIQLLIQKGTITKEEGDKLKGQIAYSEKTIREDNLKRDLPTWVQDMKLKGDFRVRHEYSRRKDAGSNDFDRDRGRLRWRLGVDTNINDKVQLAVGIASNGGDGKNSSGTATTTGTNFSPRSNNESFQNTFAKQAVVLNYAYATYLPNDKLSLLAGKMINPLWEPWEFLWDSDITPEGGAVQFNYPILGDSLKLASTLAFFQIDEITGNEADPFMMVFQGGVTGIIKDKVDYKILGSYYDTSNITKTLLANRSATNTLNPTVATQYAYHYNTYGVGADIGMNDPFGENFPVYIPRVGLFGEYMYNPNPTQNKTAYMMGGYIGNSKVSGFKTWKLTSGYKYIGKDAFLDVFPDSDFYGGSTDVKGHETLLEIGLAKNVSFAFDWYSTERIKRFTRQPETLWQTDINFKF